MVDDGSSDGTLSIATYFQEVDTRFKVYALQQNKGQGFARNYALTQASGEYVVFLDADDTLGINALHELSLVINKKHKVYLMGFKRIKGRKIEVNLPEQHLPFESPFTLLMQGSKGFSHYPWKYVSNRKHLIKNNIAFSEGIFFEDIQFVRELLYDTPKVKVLAKALYNYRFHLDSVTGQTSVRKIKDKFRAYEIEEEFLKEKGLYNQFKDLYHLRFMTFCFYTSFVEYFIHKSPSDELKAYIKKLRENKLLNKNERMRMKHTVAAYNFPKKIKSRHLAAAWGLGGIEKRYWLHKWLVKILYKFKA